jgi:hypothetical protein
MISGINEDWNYKSQQRLEENDLLQKMFRIRKKRYIAANVSCHKYDELKVDKLPALDSVQNFTERKSTYLVSPIGYDVYTKILLCMGLSVPDVDSVKPGERIEMKRYISKKQFVHIVTEEEYEDEYQFLISWVFRNQSSEIKEKLSKEQIDKKYKACIEDIYKANFKKKVDVPEMHI